MSTMHSDSTHSSFETCKKQITALLETQTKNKIPPILTVALTASTTPETMLRALWMHIPLIEDKKLHDVIKDGVIHILTAPKYDAILRTIITYDNKQTPSEFQLLHHQASMPGNVACLVSAGRTESTLATLLRCGAKIDALDTEKSTPFMKAVSGANIEAAKYLAKEGADICYTIEVKDTPILPAEEHLQKYFLRIMNLHNAVIEGDIKTAGISLQALAEIRETKILKIVIDTSISSNAQGKRTPLCSAVMYGPPEMVVWLLQQGANWQVRNEEGKTLQELAQQRLNAATTLKDKAATQSIISSLIQADSKLLDDMLERIRLFSDEIKCPVLKAALFEFTTIENQQPIMNKMRMNILTGGIKRPTPSELLKGIFLLVESARQHANGEELKGFIQKIAQENFLIEEGLKPLHIAITCGANHCAELLLSPQALQEKDARGSTPLFLAALGNLEMVKKILERKKSVKVNEQDIHGNTPLMATARAETLPDTERVSVEILKQTASLLLEAGAQTDLKNNQGKTILSIASEHSSIGKLVRDHIKKKSAEDKKAGHAAAHTGSKKKQPKKPKEKKAAPQEHPIFKAIKENNLADLESAIDAERKADRSINPLQEEETALQCALMRCKWGAAQMLLNEGAEMPEMSWLEEQIGDIPTLPEELRTRLELPALPPTSSSSLHRPNLTSLPAKSAVVVSATGVQIEALPPGASAVPQQPIHPRERKSAFTPVSQQSGRGRGRPTAASGGTQEHKNRKVQNRDNKNSAPSLTVSASTVAALATPALSALPATLPPPAPPPAAAAPSLPTAHVTAQNATPSSSAGSEDKKSVEKAKSLNPNAQPFTPSSSSSSSVPPLSSPSSESSGMFFSQAGSSSSSSPQSEMMPPSPIPFHSSQPYAASMVAPFPAPPPMAGPFLLPPSSLQQQVTLAAVMAESAAHEAASAAYDAARAQQAAAAAEQRAQFAAANAAQLVGMQMGVPYGAPPHGSFAAPFLPQGWDPQHLGVMPMGAPYQVAPPQGSYAAQCFNPQQSPGYSGPPSSFQ